MVTSILVFTFVSNKVFNGGIFGKVEIITWQKMPVFFCAAFLAILRIFGYFQTALLCSLNALENSLLPSPLPQNTDIFFLPDKAHYAMMHVLDSK
ncbi:MAG: hypothetical protein Ct9H300mP28_28300 [Pseudomonadota bacterium]|nr:MAG: hypothetical protein Ct9H300mP28_28300 [Pseudomonadota bacterium]